MPKSIYSDARRSLRKASFVLGELLDVANIPDNSPLDRKVQAALDNLYEALHEIPDHTRDAAVLKESGPLVYPVKGQDMRSWRTSDARRASALLQGRRSSRVASASQVMASPNLDRYRPMTASQYLKAFDEAVITDYSPVDANGYDKVRVLT